MHWTEKSEKKNSIADKNRKSKTAQDSNTEKPQILSAKTEPKIGQIRKTENPNGTLLNFEGYKLRVSISN